MIFLLAWAVRRRARLAVASQRLTNFVKVNDSGDALARAALFVTRAAAIVAALCALLLAHGGRP